MNPCKQCIKTYAETPCNNLGHCAFEGASANPFEKMEKEVKAFEMPLVVTD